MEIRIEAKKKAIELINSFRAYVDSEIAGEHDFVFSKEQETNMAIKCAIVTVKELMQEHSCYTLLDERWAFWAQVGIELNQTIV